MTPRATFFSRSTHPLNHRLWFALQGYLQQTKYSPSTTYSVKLARDFECVLINLALLWLNFYFYHLKIFSLETSNTSDVCTNCKSVSDP